MQRTSHSKPTAAESQRSALLQMTRLLDMTSDAVLVRDLTGVLTYWNQGAARHYGWEPSDALGTSVHELLGTVYPESIERLEGHLWQAGHWEGLLRHRRRDGSQVTVESRWDLFCGEQGEPLAILQVERPVPGRETGIDPEYAAQRIDLLEDLIQNLAATFVFLDTNWVYRLVTRQTATLLGHTVEGMLGRHFLDVFPGKDEEVARMHQAVCVEGRTLIQTAMHVALPDANGQVRDTYWDFTVRPVYDRHGVLLGLSSLGYEVSERVAMEREIAQRSDALEQANQELKVADRYKDEFLSVVSHELKTPLNFIMGFSSILADEVNGPLNAEQHLEVQRIQEGAVRLLELVNDLLDMGLMAADRFTPALAEEDFDGILAEAIATLHPLAERRRQLLDAQGSIRQTVRVDRRRILQVLGNLVGNAIRFTPEGGRIRVRAIELAHGLRVEVVDTGPGIARSDQVKLFAPFKQLDMTATRRVGGTGLGLCLSKALIEAHGGTIGLDSEPGEGCCFWFELPFGAP